MIICLWVWLKMTKPAQNWVALREWGNGTLHVYDGDSPPHSLLRASQKINQGPIFFLNLDPFFFSKKIHPKLQRFVFAGAFLTVCLRNPTRLNLSSWGCSRRFLTFHQFGGGFLPLPTCLGKKVGKCPIPAGGFKYFLFHPYFEKDSQFD